MDYLWAKVTSVAQVLTSDILELLSEHGDAFAVFCTTRWINNLEECCIWRAVAIDSFNHARMH